MLLLFIRSAKMRIWESFIAKRITLYFHSLAWSASRRLCWLCLDYTILEPRQLLIILVAVLAVISLFVWSANLGLTSTISITAIKSKNATGIKSFFSGVIWLLRSIRQQLNQHLNIHCNLFVSVLESFTCIRHSSVTTKQLQTTLIDKGDKNEFFSVALASTTQSGRFWSWTFFRLISDYLRAQYTGQYVLN